MEDKGENIRGERGGMRGKKAEGLNIGMDAGKIKREAVKMKGREKRDKKERGGDTTGEKIEYLWTVR
jgi:hypothetical protein